MEFEKKNSDIFLTKYDLDIRRFERIEYTMVQSLWEDQIIINNLYTIIDDIVKNFNLDYSSRYIIIGDFLFSITSFNLYDPSELIIKINRDTYLSRIRIRCDLIYLFNIEYDLYLIIHKKLLIGVRANSIMERSVIRTKSPSKDWSSFVNFTLNVKKDFLPIQRAPVGTSWYPFELIIISTNRYSVSSYRNIWKTKSKRREMENVSIPYDSIEIANKIGFFWSVELFNINKLLITNEYAQLLKSVHCDNLEMYLTKIKKIVRDSKYTRSIFLPKNRVHDVDHISILPPSDETHEKINLMMVFQKLISFEMCLNIKYFHQAFYMPCFMDNRGRQYYNSSFSPTFHVVYRYLIEFIERKEAFINLKTSRYYKDIMKNAELVKKFNLNEEQSYVALVLFIEVGKYFIEDNGEYTFTTKYIIERGIKSYEKLLSNIDFEDLLYVQKIYNLLNALLKHGRIDHNSLIFKDATSSGLQNLGILLGYNIEKIKYLNIDNDNVWVDTYRYFIWKYLRHVDKKYWARLLWKPLLMIIPYNGSKYTCFETLKIKLFKINIVYKNLTIDEQSEIRKMHDDFYDIIKNDLKGDLYLNNVANLKVFQYNKWIVVNNNIYKINLKKNRDKYNDPLFVLIEDKKATERSAEANNMHYLDAQLVKHLMDKYMLLTIHDCFGVRLCELHLLMDSVNAYYSNYVGVSTYSVHILI